MKQLSEPMKQIIRHYNAGSVASINEDGTPAVSPKATFVIVDDASIAYDVGIKREELIKTNFEKLSKLT